MDKISIIIPVYNVEPYIKKCLDSVIGQTYTNIEIILVNDGSTDNSGNICDLYAQSDNRIRVFHNKNNGISSARNTGLKHAIGKYIAFVDSDDMIEPDMYEVLLNAMKNTNASVSVSGFYLYTDYDSIKATNETYIPNKLISQENMLIYPLKRDYYFGFCGYLWNKLFSTEIFLNNNLMFDENINYGEDVLFYLEAIIYGKASGVYTDKPLYHYRQRDTSASKIQSIETKADILIAYKRIENLFNTNGFSHISYWARGFYCHHASVIAEIAIKNNNIEILRFMQNEIYNHLKDYKLTNRDFPEKIERINRILNG